MVSTPTGSIATQEPSKKPFAEIRHDGPASLVVALVALPLCLGIALASGAVDGEGGPNLMAGLISGIVGGMVVAWLSGSSLAVSGPAAGLTVVVLSGVQDLGYPVFLLAVVLSGLIQIGFGVARLGIFGYYIPSSVIRGMLAAIGLILILKQIPHAVGWDKDYEGDLAFFQADGQNTFSEILRALENLELGAVIIAFGALIVLRLAPKVPGLNRVKLLPPPLLAVLFGCGLNAVFGVVAPGLALSGEFLVQIPRLEGISDLVVVTPAFEAWSNPAVYKTAFVLAAIASIETLLCVEAVDKLDPFKRVTPANRELLAQGVGNSVAGLLGGLPITAVIVRGSANVHSGGRTPASAFLHGLWLLLALFLIPGALNAIPLAALAAVLLDVGYKLAPVSLFQTMYRQGMNLFLPFVATVAGILLTDLLTGVIIGLVAGVFFVLKNNLETAYFIHHLEEREGTQGLNEIRMELSENVSFLNKAAVTKALHNLPEGSFVLIDGRASRHVDHDVAEIIHEFAASTAPSRAIQVRIEGIPKPTGAGAH